MRRLHSHEGGARPRIEAPAGARLQSLARSQVVEKLEDIIGLYLSPPEHALVLCCDEKSQVQALERTQPGLPMKKGRAATMTHDYQSATEQPRYLPHSTYSMARSFPSASSVIVTSSG